MADARLTKEIIATAKSRETPYALKDIDGLYLWVTPTAGKLWRWNYKLDGQTKVMPYGEWPRVSLERARAEHAKAQRLVTEGINPIAWERAAKRRAKYLRTARKEERQILETLQMAS